jgi:hypothetical protein
VVVASLDVALVALVAVRSVVKVTAVLRVVVATLPVVHTHNARYASRSDTQPTIVGIDLKKITFWSNRLLQPLLDRALTMLGTRIHGPQNTLLESLIGS